jgi:methyltransferase (TIGR00027 family)
MDIDWPSSTNKGTALLRLMHQFDPGRILRDDYVSWFFDESTTANLRNENTYVNNNPNDSAQVFSRIAYRYAILREKHIDGIIEHSVESGCRQLLLLGSGYDTRFFRLPSIRKHSVATFEVDLPDTIKEKMMVLKKRLGSLPAGLSLIPLNFNENDWDGIVRGGFQPEIPTVYVWQGVSYYLPEQTVFSVLNYIRSKMVAGSILAFDCCWPLMLTENDEIPGIRFHIERLKQIGEPYIFGIDPKDMQSWLEGKGFRNICISSPNDLEMTYMHSSTLPRKTWYVVTAA